MTNGSDDAIDHFEANQTFILIWIGQNWVSRVSVWSSEVQWSDELEILEQDHDFDQEKGFILWFLPLLDVPLEFGWFQKS